MSALAAQYPLNQPWIVWVAAGALTAGMVRGLTGFGATMVLFPILSLAVPPTTAAPIVQALDCLLALPFLPGAARACRWTEVVPLSVGAIAFVPAGVALLVYVDAHALKSAAAIIILVVVGLIASGWRYHGTSGLKTSLAVGALSGLMGGSTTLSGPPVALFWLGGHANAANARASMILFIAITEFATLIAYAMGGLFTGDITRTILLLAPPFAAGLFLGAILFRVVAERFIRRVALTLIAVVAAVCLIR